MGVFGDCMVLDIRYSTIFIFSLFSSFSLLIPPYEVYEQGYYNALNPIPSSVLSNLASKEPILLRPQRLKTPFISIVHVNHSFECLHHVKHEILTVPARNIIAYGHVCCDISDS